MRLEQELLFGLLSVQLGLVKPKEAKSAGDRWASEPGHSLPDILFEEARFSAQQRQILEAMVVDTLSSHPGDFLETIESQRELQAVVELFGEGVTRLLRTRPKVGSGTLPIADTGPGTLPIADAGPGTLPIANAGPGTLPIEPQDQVPGAAAEAALASSGRPSSRTIPIVMESLAAPSKPFRISIVPPSKPIEARPRTLPVDAPPSSPARASSSGEPRPLPTGDQRPTDAPTGPASPVDSTPADAGVRLSHTDRFALKGGPAEGALIGKGGLGRVLVAYDKHIGREVALKELLPAARPKPRRAHVDTKADVLVRFVREAMVTGQLEHPSIVPVYDVGQWQDGTPFYAMKRVRGRTLWEAVRAAPDLTGRLALLSHFIDLCQAISYAHSRGVVHRDIKPQNIMLGEFGETVVLDWGLAKVRGEEDLRGQEIVNSVRDISKADASHTVYGRAFGTPAYMSPEQARGKLEQIDERSDVWSLGAVLYEILTGRAPYQGDLALDVVSKVINENAPPLREVCPEAPPELASVCHKAMSRDPAERYQSAKELAAEIEAYQVGARVSAYVYGSWELLARFAARNKKVLVAAAVAAVLLAVLGVTSHLRVVAERNQSLVHLAEAQREGARTALSRNDMLEARAKLRGALEIQDSATGRGLWQKVDASPLAWTKVLGGELFAVDFSPDGATVAVGGYDGIITLIDVTTLQVRLLRGHQDYVRGLSFSPDGRALLSACEDGSVRLWDVASGETVRQLAGHTSRVWRVRFGADGRRAVTAADDNTVRLWDVATGAERRRFEGHGDRVWSAALSPDGRTVASGSRDRSIKLWDAEGGQVLASLSGHEAEGVADVAFSPDGKLLASAGWDGTVRIWELAARRQQRGLVGHRDAVWTVQFSPDGSRLLSAGRDQSVRIWDLVSGTTLRTLEGHPGAIWSATFGPDGQEVASVDLARQVKLWDLRAAGVPRPEHGHTASVWGVALTPDGARIASGGWDKTVRLWDLRSGQELQVLNDHQTRISCVAVSPDGKLLASGGEDRKIWLWDLPAGTVHGVLEGHQAGVRFLAFSPDSSRVASAGWDKTARVWDVATNSQLAVLKAHTAQVSGVAFSPDGAYLATASFDGTVRRWRAASGEPLEVFRGHTEPVVGVAYSPDGAHIASGGDDMRVLLWEPATGQQREVGRHAGRVYRMHFSRDGQVLATASADRTAKLWPLQGGEPVTLVGHRTEVNEVVLTPDANLAVTVGDDETVRVWDAKTGAPFWRAAALLPQRDAGALLYNHQGWSALGAERAAEVDADAPLRQALAGARRSAVSPGDGTVCLQAPGGELELWDASSQARLQVQAVPPLDALEAAEGGCLSLAGGAADLLLRSGERRALGKSATAVAWTGERALVAAEHEVHAFGQDGRDLERYRASGQATALLRTSEWLVLGFGDGSLELVPAVPGAVAPGLTFEGVQACPVRQLIEGPMGLLIVGYDNGLVGLWDLGTGARVNHAKLHGPVTHLLQRGTRLFAATALGDAMVWDLSVFHRAYCDMMQEVWAKVPVLWEGERLQKAAPPRHHACSGG